MAKVEGGECRSCQVCEGRSKMAIKAWRLAFGDDILMRKAPGISRLFMPDWWPRPPQRAHRQAIITLSNQIALRTTRPTARILLPVTGLDSCVLGEWRQSIQDTVF